MVDKGCRLDSIAAPRVRENVAWVIVMPGFDRFIDARVVCGGEVGDAIAGTHVRPFGVGFKINAGTTNTNDCIRRGDPRCPRGEH